MRKEYDGTQTPFLVPQLRVWRMTYGESDGVLGDSKYVPAVTTRQAPHTEFGGPSTEFGVPLPNNAFGR